MAMSSILVVDDEPHICELLHSYFTDHGHKVYVAETGQEALARTMCIVPPRNSGTLKSLSGTMTICCR